MEKEEKTCCMEHEHHHNHEHKFGCHHHEHHHEHEEHDMKKEIVIISITVVLLIAAYIIDKTCALPTWQLLLVYLVPYLLVGHHTIDEAIEGLLDGESMNEDLLMTVATLGALAIGFMPGAENEFPEAVFVMLFFQIGEMFEGYAEGQSRNSISHLMDIRPDTANLIKNPSSIPEQNSPIHNSFTKEDRSIKVVNPEDVAVGSSILVRPGEKIPLDGIIIDGHSSLNTVALTGESMPREVESGSEVVSGCINLSGVLTIKTTKTFGDSTVSKIIDLVENAAQHKSSSETFIARFARVYTPIVVYTAIAMALIPPALSGAYSEVFPIWLQRALIFLVVSCPCALVISVPLTFFGGIGGASRKGILIKGANFIDQLAAVDTVVFDKTGTLTNGTFVVTEVIPTPSFSYKGIGSNEEKLLHLAAIAERHSTHPIATALRNADTLQVSRMDSIPTRAFSFRKGFLACEGWGEAEEISGHGIRTEVDGETISVGNGKMMDMAGATWSEVTTAGTVIYVARGKEYLGHIIIKDSIKADTKKAIDTLWSIGIKNTVMLTGDREDVAKDVANQLGLTEYHANLLPTDKVSHVECLIKKEDENGRLAFVGDGINDAPVLARADVGIAMGAMGSDAAIEAADVVLMNDTPSSIATAIKIARRTIKIARENVIFAIGVKVAVLLLAVFGLGNMWMAVFADVGVTVLAVFNAMRALR